MAEPVYGIDDFPDDDTLWRVEWIGGAGYNTSVPSDPRIEAILHALSDPVRVAIFAQIVGSDCSHNCSNFLQVSEKTIPKSTLSLHFKALREAGLIRGERRGVEMHNTSRCAELDKRFPGLIAAIVKAHKPVGTETARCEGGKTYASARGVKG